MPTTDPESLAQAIDLVFQKLGLGPSAWATPALRFRESVELEDGTLGPTIVEAPAVRIGDKIAIRVEEDYYRVYNLASTPYHGLFHHGFCKTTNPRHAIRAAVMASIYEHFTGLFEEFDFGALLDDG